MGIKNSEELTDQSFWDDYWKNCKIPNTVDLENSFDRCVACELKKRINDGKGKSVLEIGCAPGRWLSFLAKEFGMIPSGIDYSAEGIEATRRNFEYLNLRFGELRSADFLTAEPFEKYDMVISLGFIEHFDNPDDIVAKHLGWLKPGGMLILGVPNFRGIYEPIQKILSNNILEKHNLEIMTLGYFRSLASKFNLELLSASYLGSFEPCLFIDENEKPNFFHILINHFLQLSKKIRKWKALDHINNKFISSYILATYRHKA